MIISALSDVGKKRKINEDSYYICKHDDENAYVIVADGMGGHKGGNLASKWAIDNINEFLSKENREFPFDCDDVLSLMTACIKYANNNIYIKSLDDDELIGMGTTIVLCVIKGRDIYIANVGDSRLYLIDKKNIIQITKDNSLVQELLDMGKITEDEFDLHPNKNVITRAIGSEADVEIDLYSKKLSDADIILICSDGLTNMVDNMQIFNELISESDPNKNVVNLINMANSNGGIDNITVVEIIL